MAGTEPNFSRRLAQVAAFLIPTLCILWNLNLPIHLGIPILTEQLLALMLGLGIAILFLTIRIDGSKGGTPSLLDYALAAAGFGALLFSSLFYASLLERIADRPIELIVIGGIVVVCVMEGLRRAAGLTLFLIIAIFVAYALLAHLAPGPLVGRQMGVFELVQYIGFDPSAVFGTPLKIAGTIVVLFIFFGTLLFKAGGGEFFTDLALATTGSTRGGAAKIAVVASALFGSISGSAVSNVATTGVITIPLMRRGGYRAEDAGAIEAIASTGGQLTPPIMGAAAFLMAEFLEIPYLAVVTAAILPAVLYYVSIFLQVDLIAARDRITAVDTETRTLRTIFAEGWHLILPFVILMAALFWLEYSPEYSALMSALSIVVVGLLRPYRGMRLGFGEIIDSFVDTGRSVIELLLIVAAAGFVIGILNITGLGFSLTLLLLQSVGSNMVVLLLVSAAICIVLGMGMPTSGVYVLLAVLIAPAIVEAGIDPIAAHMFILYYGMMSMITPPIALAAFAAAAISKANAMSTGFAAMRIGWVAYVIPFIFVFSPAIMLQGSTADMIADTGRALVGIFAVTVGIVGYLTARLPLWARLALGTAGILCMPFHAVHPAWVWINAAMIATAIGLTVVLILSARGKAAAAAATPIDPKPEEMQ